MQDDVQSCTIHTVLGVGGGFLWATRPVSRRVERARAPALGGCQNITSIQMHSHKKDSLSSDRANKEQKHAHAHVRSTIIQHMQRLFEYIVRLCMFLIFSNTTKHAHMFISKCVGACKATKCMMHPIGPEQQ